MPRRMTERGHGRDAGHDVAAIRDEGDLFRQRHDLRQHRLVPVLGRSADAGAVLPEVVLDLSGHIARIGKSGLSTLRQAPDMVTVHVSDDDDRHLFRGITGSLQAFRKLARARLATSLAKPGVEENDLGSGIDQDRGKAVDEAAGRQEILFQKLGDRLRRLIGTEDLVRLVRGARPVADHRHLEIPSFNVLKSALLPMPSFSAVS